MKSSAIPSAGQFDKVQSSRDRALKQSMLK